MPNEIPPDAIFLGGLVTAEDVDSYGTGWVLTAADDDGNVELFIYGRIGASFWSRGVDAEEVVKDLAELDATKITVRINSPGGNALDGMAIYNALRRHKAEIVTEVDGMAASAASVIMMAGKDRRVGVGTQVMIHQATGGSFGRAADMRVMAKLLDDVNGDMAKLYLAKAGGKEAEWLDAMTETTWYNADAAVKAGLATEAIDDADPEEDDPDETDASHEGDLVEAADVSIAAVLELNEGAKGPDEAAPPYIPTAADETDDPEDDDADEADDDTEEDVTEPDPALSPAPDGLGALSASWPTSDTDVWPLTMTPETTTTGGPAT